MKSIYKNLLVIIIVIFSSQACTEDFLNLEPKTGQVEANFYKTEDDAFLAVVGIYDALSVQNWQFVPTMSDIFSDDTYKGGANAKDMDQFNEIETGNISTENEAAKELWNRCYSGIYRANLYLEKQNDIQWQTNGLKDRLEAEAKFLRAYFYWDLVRHFGWVPIIKEVLPSVDDYKSVEQNTPEEVYNFVASDLLFAIEHLPETVAPTQAGRATKYAAQALLVRVYMLHEDFAKPVLGVGNLTNNSIVVDKSYAQNALEEIISSGVYSLQSSYKDVFAWDNENNSESIFEWQYSEKANSGDWSGWNINGNFSVAWYGPRDSEGDPVYSVLGWSLSTITWSLVNEFEEGDPRKDVTVYDAEERTTSYTKAYQNTGYFNKKYMARLDFPYEGGDPVHNWRKNFIDIRYAEVLLMAAELFLYDDLAKAQKYYNMVRKRAFGENHVAPMLSSDDVGLDLIYHEKRVEFGCEGVRKWDLLRRGFDFTKQKINASFNVPEGIPNKQDFVGYGFNENSYGMFPIPAHEIRNTNSGVLQQYIPSYQ